MIMDDPEATRLLRLLPPIKRARGWRLYAVDGRRFLDLWMDGGAALPGSGKTGFGRSLKEAIDTGTTRPLPSIWEHRLRTELVRRWPEYPVHRVFRSQDAASLALVQASRQNPGIPERAVLLHPFSAMLQGTIWADALTAPVVAPILPCPGPFSPGILLVRDPKVAEALEDQVIPPVAAMALVRGLAAFDRFLEAYIEGHWRGIDRFVGALYVRRGPCLLPRYAPEAHATVFARALEAGILLPPRYEWPALVPGDYDPGELAPLATLFRPTAAREL